MNNEQVNLHNDEQEKGTPKQNDKLGSGPSADIPNGGHGEKKQDKENSGKDSNMGGAGGGTTGLGNGKQIES